MQKDLSFIIPMYNVEKYLRRCLESIIDQNVRKEIILIDDGSTDDTAIIAQAYLSLYPDIILIKKHNGGVSSARNAGLRLATGRYVYFVDADDVVLERNLDAMVVLADQNRADWLKGTIVNSYENKPTKQLRPNESPNLTQADRFEVTNGFTHLNQMLSKDWLPSLGFGFFRRAFLQENGFTLPENIGLSECSLFITKILTNQKDMRVVEVSRPFYEYCRRENSPTTQKNNVAGFANLFELGQELQQHHIDFVNKFVTNNPATQQAAFDILRVMAINYGIAHRYHYAQFDAQTKQANHHFFTPEIIAFMQEWLGYDVVL